MSKPEENVTRNAKITQSLAKGCGCFSIVFIVFFAWGIWTTYTTYSSIVEVSATVDNYVEVEKTDLDAKFSMVYSPIVSYKYQGKKYTDTLDYKASVTRDYEVGSSMMIYLHPENPQFAIENSTDTYYFYIIFFVLALFSYLVYKKLRNPQKQLFSGNRFET